MLNTTLKEEWETYAKTVLHRSSPEGLRQAKIVYFSGAYTMFLEMNVAAKHCKTEEEGSARIDSLQKECIEAFMEVPGFSESDGGEPD